MFVHQPSWYAESDVEFLLGHVGISNAAEPIQRLIRSGTQIDPEAIADAERPLESLLEPT